LATDERMLLKRDNHNRIQVYDTIDGAHRPELEVRVSQVRKPKFKEPYYQMFQVRKLATMGLTGKEWSVLSLMLDEMEFDNWINVCQKDMAKELGIADKNVSTLIKHLIDKGIIHKEAKFNKKGKYRLNPLYGWKGDAQKCIELRQQKHLHLVQ
jgi:predicted transcriptional regulator